MQIPKDAMLLRIFCGEDDNFGQKPFIRSNRAQGSRTASWGSNGTPRFYRLRTFQPTAHG